MRKCFGRIVFLLEGKSGDHNSKTTWRDPTTQAGKKKKKTLPSLKLR